MKKRVRLPTLMDAIPVEIVSGVVILNETINIEKVDSIRIVFFNFSYSVEKLNVGISSRTESSDASLSPIISYGTRNFFI